MTTPFRTLIINPGSTSNKIAVYDDDQLLLSHSVEHPGEQLQAFERIADQFEMRRKMIVDLLAEKRIALDSLLYCGKRGCCVHTRGTYWSMMPCLPIFVLLKG